MSGRRCVSCGAPVGSLADRCPRCGADPDVALIELGVGDDKPAGPWPRRPQQRRSWLPLVGTAIAAWALFVVIGAVRDDAADDGGDASAVEDSARDEPDATTTTPTSAAARPTAVAGVTLSGSLGEATGLHIVATRPGAVIDLDLDTGTAVEHEINGVVVDANRFGLVVVDDGALVWRPFPVGSTAAVTLAPYDDALQAGWLLEDATGLWYSEGSGPVPAARTMQLLAMDGSGVIAEASLPIEAFSYGTSGDLLVVNAAGRVYTIDPRGDVADLGPGLVLAAGSGYVVVSRCDEQLRCRPVRIHLESGEAELMPGLEEMGEVGFGGASIAPSGDVLYASFGPEPRIFVASPAGTRELLDPDRTGVDFTTSGSFSLDGRWVCLAAGLDIWVGPTAGGEGVYVELPGGFRDRRALLLDRPVW